MEHVRENTKLDRLLMWCQERQATDIHGQAGNSLVIRVNGRLERAGPEVFDLSTNIEVMALFADSFSSHACAQIEERNEHDLSFYHGELRYRANFSKQKGRQSFSLRIVPQQCHQLADLQLPESLADLVEELRGLVLVTGPTGQGKSTTLRALLQHLNRTRGLRIVTIEDPIEFVFEDECCNFEQREVGIDTRSFADGIRNAMRQDPEVIFVGEIRDQESIFAAMQAAETGHLVLTTLHADSVAQALARIQEFYPASEQRNIRSLLARNLNSIVCQRLVPNVAGTRTPCLEIMRRDAGVRDAIINGELNLLTGIVETSVNVGMHTFDQYLTELHAAGVVDEATLREFAVNYHQLELRLRGVSSHRSILKPDSGR